MLGSDVCAAPTAAILRATNNQPQLAYYLTCATNPGLSPPDFLSFITSALTKLASVVAQIGKITDMANSVGAGPTAGYGPLVSAGVAAADLTAASSNAAAAVSSISIIPNTVFSCVQVDALFSSLFDSLCNGTVSAAAGIAQCLVAAAVLMLLQMAIGIDICCYHPGDKTAWVDKGEMEEGRNCCGFKKRGAASVRVKRSPSLLCMPQAFLFRLPRSHCCLTLSLFIYFSRFLDCC